MLTEIIRYTSIASIGLPIVILAQRSILSKARAYILLTFALLASLSSDIIQTILGILKIPNLIVGNIYAVIFFVLIAGLYKSLLPGKSAQLNFIIAIYCLFLVINSFFFQHFTEYQGYSRAFGGVLLITCSFMYFKFLIQKLPSPTVLEFGPFWINTAIAFYFSFNMLLFIFGNFVFTKMSTDVGMAFWSFHNVNNIIKNVLFALGIYYAGSRTVESATRL